MKRSDINERMCLGRLEGDYLRNKRVNINVSLEDIEDTEWFWSNNEIKKFKALWKKDTPIQDMAVDLKRSEIAVFLQALDLIYRGEVKPRNWRIW